MCVWFCLFQMPRKKWVLLWPGQVVICASCIFWTSEVSDAIQNNTLPVSTSAHRLLQSRFGLVELDGKYKYCAMHVFQAYVDQSNAQIADIVELVRGKLPGGARMTLGALIVIDVHGKCHSGMPSLYYLYSSWALTLSPMQHVMLCASWHRMAFRLWMISSGFPSCGISGRTERSCCGWSPPWSDTDTNISATHRVWS